MTDLPDEKRETIARAIRGAKYATSPSGLRDHYSDVTRRDREIAEAVIAGLQAEGFRIQRNNRRSA